MAVSIDSLLLLTAVAFLWGVTNPFMKKGTAGLEKIKASSLSRQLINQIIFVITNLRYIIPFCINQLGSILFFITIQNTDISIAVPVANALTFVITAVTGWILGEDKIHKNTYIGMVFVLIGLTLCCWDKVN